MNKVSATLAVRPRPTPGEATPGFLIRVASANGFRSVRQLLTSLRTHKQPAFEELCGRLRLSDAERSCLFGPLQRQWGLSEIPRGLRMADFNLACLRWCPACLKEGLFIQGRWTMKMVCICTRHSVWLQDTCPQCRREARWSYGSLRYCECGAILANASTEPANETVREITKQLCGDGGLRAAHNLEGLSPSNMHRLVRFLGMFPSEVRPARPGRVAYAHRVSIAKALIVGTAVLLESWPSGLHTVMAAMQASAPTSPSVRRTFAPLYRVLYEELSDRCFQFLRDGFESYLHERWWGLVCKRNKLMQRQTIDVHPRLSVRQTATAAGVKPSVVRHLAQAEMVFTTTSTLASGRTAATLHRNTVTRIRELTSGAVSIEQAAKFLALSERRLRDLIAHGIVTPLISRYTNRHAGAWLIPASEIHRLSLRPDGPIAGDGIAVHDVLKYWRLRGIESVELVKAVITRQLLTQGEDYSPVPLGKALLNRAEASQWLASGRAADAQGLSVDQAAKTLGIKQQVAYDLVRLGLLANTPHPLLGRRVTASDLRQFQTTYVSLADYARTVGRSPRSMLTSLAVAPVCGPAVDGTRQYFFRKIDLPSHDYLADCQARVDGDMRNEQAVPPALARVTDKTETPRGLVRPLTKKAS